MFACFLLYKTVGSHGVFQYPHVIHWPGARRRKYNTSDVKMTLPRGFSDKFVAVSDATRVIVKATYNEVFHCMCVEKKR